MARLKELKPVVETDKDFDPLIDIVLNIFYETIYKPLVKELKIKKSTLTNAGESVAEAIRSGRLTFRLGRFRGNFNSTLSKELQSLGATWDAANRAWRIEKGMLPQEIRSVIDASAASFEAMTERMDAALARSNPTLEGSKVKMSRFFDSTLFRTDQRLAKTLENISIVPKLTKADRTRISEEYTRNIDLYIRDFKEKETVELRKRIEQSVFAGERQKAIEEIISDSYEVSRNKAKFLARQESKLLVVKYKQIRYEEAGVDKYRWQCVTGTALHPVRPLHKIHNGKIFSFRDPPIVDKQGNKKNPGQDYNCRCQAIPIVEF